MILKSESEKRLIIKGQLNGKAAYMLVDTGAVCGLFSKQVAKRCALVENKHRSINLVGAFGKPIKANMCDTPLMVGGRPMYQFAIADISSVVESIKKETGIEIAGLISLPQMRSMGFEIDTDDNYVKVGGLRNG